MTRQSVLLTGGAGFIGSTLIPQLVSSGYLVTVYDNLTTGSLENFRRDEAVTFVYGDITDFHKLSKLMQAHDSVIHLAAQAYIPLSYQFPLSIAQTNSLGSLTIFKAAESSTRVKRIVHVSSSEVYGSAIYTPMDEKHPLNPASTYAVTKLAADLWAQTMIHEHKLPIVILRPFNTFGPRDTCPRFIPEIIRQCFKETTINVGNIETYRDYTYVQDTAQAILLTLETEGIEGEIINIGTGKMFKMARILKMIKEIIGIDTRILLDENRLRPQDVPVLRANANRASQLLRWKPEVEFDEGLQKTVDWYKNNGKTWVYEKRGWNWRY